MGKLYDIANRMAEGNKKPEVKIDEEHTYKINTSKSAALFIQGVTEDEEVGSFEQLDRIITTALGKEAFEYIDSLDMSVGNLSLIVEVIMAAISDVPLEELEASMKEEAKKPGKKSK